MSPPKPPAAGAACAASPRSASASASACRNPSSSARSTRCSIEELERALLAEINLEEDNLRFYRLTEPHELRVKQYGVFRSVDFDGPLVV